MIDAVRTSESEILQPRNPKVSKKKKIIKISIISAVILVVIGGIIAGIVIGKQTNESNDPTPNTSQEYNPYTKSQKLLLDTPYEKAGQLQINPNLQSSLGLEPQLDIVQSACEEGQTYKPVDPKQIQGGDYNSKASTVSYIFTVTEQGLVRLQIYDQFQAEHNNVNFVPEDIFPRPKQSKSKLLESFGLTIEQSSQFAFSFQDKNNPDATLLTTKERKLMISLKFAEIGFQLPSDEVFGLGFHYGQLKLQPGAYNLYARGRVGQLPQETYMGLTSGNHIHPFLLCKSPEGKFVGMFFVSLSSQTFELINLEQDNKKKNILNYISLDGQIEIYFMFGNDATSVVQQYQSLVGRPMVPPYYSLGVTQTVQAEYGSLPFYLKDVVTPTNNMKLSIEGFHLDNLSEDRLFEVPQGSQAQYYKNISQGLTNIGQRLSIGINAYYDKDDQSFAKKILRSCDITWTNDTKLEGQGQFSFINYPEFYDFDCSQQFFQEGLRHVRDSISSFDYLQVSGMEFQNLQQKQEQYSSPRRFLAQNESEVGNCEPYYISTNLFEDSYKNLPYSPSKDHYLDYMTIPPNVPRKIKQKNKEYTSIQDYYIHNGNSLKGVQVITEALSNLNTGKRPFIMSDVTWAGSGMYTSAQITKLERTYESMKISISMAMQLSLYGFSSIMVDAGGSLGEFGPDQEDLAARWFSIAAYFPSARNHYIYDKDQIERRSRNITSTPEFTKYKNQENVRIVKKALEEKLQISLYVYSQMFYIHKYGGVIMRSLYFDYPQDANLTNDMLESFMLGQSLMVAPPLQKEDKYEVYFPEGVWGNINKLMQYDTLVNSTGSNFTLKRDPYLSIYINVFIKEGQIIPYTKDLDRVKKEYGITTTDIRSLNTTLIMNRGKDKTATGYLYYDDGVSDIQSNDENYQFWKIKLNQNSINFWLDSGNLNFKDDNSNQDYIESIIILNFRESQNQIKACVAQITEDGLNFTPLKVQFKIDTLQIDVGMRIKDIKFIQYGDSTWCEDKTKVDAPIINKSNSEISFDFKSENFIFDFKLLQDSDTVHMKLLNYESQSQSTQNELYTIQANDTEDVDIRKYIDSDNIDASMQQYGYYIKSSYPGENIRNYDCKDLMVSNINNFYYESAKIQATYLIAFGERTSDFFQYLRLDASFSSFTNGFNDKIDNDQPPSKSRNGFWQVLSFVSENDDPYSKEFHAIVTVNPTASEIIINDYNKTTKTIGLTTMYLSNQIERYMFSAFDLEKLTKKMQNQFGLPIAPPLWAFGIQQCNRGLHNYSEWKSMIDRFIEYSIPLDSACLDIDYMNKYQMFTISPEYQDIKNFKENLKEWGRNLKLMPVISAGVPDTSDADRDIFIQAPNGEALEGQLYGNKVLYPDFTNTKTLDWWSQSLQNLSEALNISSDILGGYWLIDNEPSNECDGYCNEKQRPLNSIKDTLLYTPTSRDLETKTIGLDAIHSNGKTQFELHNLYGYQQVKATYDYLKTKTQTPFIMSASSYFGMGQYGHHWIGDYYMTEEYLNKTVQQMYQASFAGMPFVGTDICGTYTLETNMALIVKYCTRWYQLGSLSPYARIYNKNDSISLNPTVFKDILYKDSDQKTEKSYMDIIREALQFRYNLIRYYYSEFQEIALTGGTFFRPLAFDFPNADKVFKDTTISFLLGNSLKASIQIFNTATQNTLYLFPAGKWCQIHPVKIQDEQDKYCFTTTTSEEHKLLSSKLDEYHVHLREGRIIPYQDIKNPTSIRDIKNNFLNIYISPKTQDGVVTAEGQISYGDSDDLNLGETLKFEIQMNHSAGQNTTISFSQVRGSKPKDSMSNELRVQDIWIYGDEIRPLTAQVQVVYELEGKVYSSPRQIEQDRDILKIKSLNLEIWTIQRIEMQV